MNVKGDYCTGCTREQRVHRVEADGVAGINVEPEPAKEQDERPYDYVWDAMPRQYVRRTVGIELAFAGPHDYRSRKGYEAAHCVNHTRTGVVRSGRKSNDFEIAQPSTTPYPVTVQGIDYCPYDEAVGQVGLGFGPLGHCARHDSSGGAGKNHLEHPVNVGLPIGRFRQDEVGGSSNSQGRGTPHEGEAEGPERQGRDGKVHETLRHIVGRVFGPYQPGAQKGESRLHKEHQESPKHPNNIGALV